ncbi:hypothetical protein BKD30_13945 [Tersicoccus phoenicis]|uniref:Uncharacterized protein n=1 Tax=Tersicoccus phoenicis TaxID=554083 RepID=A0A1R1L6R4_9MICC|nr:helix-turn-helix transcriptional regulator [Tersicoccus phoenicis]OMH23230.1 hypothetical protein BKD30_13945 [Tersicoccus phoenicis]
MTLSFRHLEVSPADPVEDWGFEGILTAVERGDIRDWRRIAAAVIAHPWGRVADEVAEVAGSVENPAMTIMLDRVLATARTSREARERAEVARRMLAAVSASGLSRKDFAARMGTSGSRWSTYLTGRVTPSAALLVRAEGIARDVGG